MPNDTTRIDQLLRFDPYAAGEQLARLDGRGLQDQQATGFALHIAHTHLKHKALMDSGDTALSTTVRRYREIITELGFELVLTVPFTVVGIGSPTRSEAMYVYAHRDGMLLKFDTFTHRNGRQQVPHVNGGNLYFCWQSSVPNRAPHRSSGRFNSLPTADALAETDLYWVGYLDCREAIRHKVNGLLADGKLFPKWPEGNDQFLWLLHYGDTKDPDYDHKAITSQRVTVLPQWVRDMVNP